MGAPKIYFRNAAGNTINITWEGPVGQLHKHIPSFVCVGGAVPEWVEASAPAIRWGVRGPP